MSPRVSIVAPVYNEASILPVLARRCLAAARRIDPNAEVLLVDDASTDDTRTVAPTLPPGVRVLHLDQNRGQLGATRAGLRQATGDVVVVLDGDLQDPPERIPHLVGLLWATPSIDAVLAVKAGRRDALWVRAAASLYGALQRVPGSAPLPRGAGAYVALRHEVAVRLAATSVPEANLAALLAALGVRSRTLPYLKTDRYDGHGRIGLRGLVREALASLALTGAVGAWLGWAGLGLGLAALLTRSALALVGGAALALGGRLTTRRARRGLHATESP